MSASRVRTPRFMGPPSGSNGFYRDSSRLPGFCDSVYTADGSGVSRMEARWRRGGGETEWRRERSLPPVSFGGIAGMTSGRQVKVGFMNSERERESESELGSKLLQAMRRY